GGDVESNLTNLFKRLCVGLNDIDSSDRQYVERRGTYFHILVEVTKLIAATQQEVFRPATYQVQRRESDRHRLKTRKNERSVTGGYADLVRGLHPFSPEVKAFGEQHKIRPIDQYIQLCSSPNQVGWPPDKVAIFSDVDEHEPLPEL